MAGGIVGGALNLVGNIVGGVGNGVGGLLGGHQQHQVQGSGGPGKSDLAPGHGAALNHGQAKKLSEETQKLLQDDQFQQPPPALVDIKPGGTGERPKPKEEGEDRSAQETGGPPEVTGRKGPAGKDPWISQIAPDGADESYKNGDQNCAPAVAAMVARNIGFGKDMTDAKLITELGTVGGTTAQGTSGNGLIAMFEHMGMQTNATPGPDLGWMQQELQAGHHVAVLGDYYEVPNHQQDGATSGHYLDVTGMTKEGNFLVNDPADPSTSELTAAQMQKFIASAPNGGFAISAW
jgi:peptidase C39-like protein